MCVCVVYVCARVCVVYMCMLLHACCTFLHVAGDVDCTFLLFLLTCRNPYLTFAGVLGMLVCLPLLVRAEWRSGTSTTACEGPEMPHHHCQSRSVSYDKGLSG